MSGATLSLKNITFAYDARGLRFQMSVLMWQRASFCVCWAHQGVEKQHACALRRA